MEFQQELYVTFFLSGRTLGKNISVDVLGIDVLLAFNRTWKMKLVTKKSFV